MLLHRDKLIIG